MNNVKEQIEKYLGYVPEYVAEISADGQIILQDDGFGPYIREWTIIEKEKPDF